MYVCQNCGTEFLKWAGQCGSCGKWGTLVETLVSTKVQSSKLKAQKAQVARLVRLSEVKVDSGVSGRMSTGMGEFDRVLGGGIVPGSVVLIAGEPGIGKSTLLSQLAMRVGQENSKLKVQNSKLQLKSQKLSSVLYVCGEESPEQVALRVKRLSGNGQLPMANGQLLLLPETDVDTITATIEQTLGLSMVIVDSIQSLTTGDLAGMAGAVGQVRESAYRLIRIAKNLQVPIFIVGHVTKEGSIAGPKVLEHMVDAVLELTGERTGAFRILRAVKNRFGATDEVGVFAMAEEGLAEVTNPSQIFLSEAQEGVPGSATVVVMEGTRPVLVEIQALVVASQLPVPRRVAHGVPLTKVQLLTAVLQKRARLSGLGTSDIFANVAGGIKVFEPAADLGLALAMASSLLNKPLPKKTALIGEVGLLGEIRTVSYLKKRVAEARKLGFTKIVTPEEVRSVAQAVKRLLA